MPRFEDQSCSASSQANICIKVIFSNGNSDVMDLKKTSPFIFEGNLNEDEDVGVVLIDNPQEQTRLVIGT